MHSLFTEIGGRERRAKLKSNRRSKLITNPTINYPQFCLSKKSEGEQVPSSKQGKLSRDSE